MESVCPYNKKTRFHLNDFSISCRDHNVFCVYVFSQPPNGNKKNHAYKKKQGWQLVHKKYKANKSMKTHVTKENDNQDIVNTLII
jgi:hypothetical protein